MSRVAVTPITIPLPSPPPATIANTEDASDAFVAPASSPYVPCAQHFVESREYYRKLKKKKRHVVYSPSTPSEEEVGVELPKYGVARIQTVGGDGWFGCPYFNTTNQHIDCEAEPIYELRDTYSPEEWRRFTKRTEMEKFISEENSRIYPLGLRWQMTFGRIEKSCSSDCAKCAPEQRFSFTMTWLPGVRESYEVANPKRRQISKEPYPAQLISPKQRKDMAAARKAATLKEEQLKTIADMIAQGLALPYDTQLSEYSLTLPETSVLITRPNSPILGPRMNNNNNNNNKVYPLTSRPAGPTQEEMTDDAPPPPRILLTSATFHQYPLNAPGETAANAARDRSDSDTPPNRRKSAPSGGLIPMIRLHQPPQPHSPQQRPISSAYQTPHEPASRGTGRPYTPSTSSQARHFHVGLAQTQNTHVCFYCSARSAGQFCLKCGEPFQDANGEYKIHDDASQED